MEQLDLFNLKIEATTVDENEEVLLVPLQTNETRHRSLVKIGEGIFFKEVLKEQSFAKGHDMYTPDYCREICKECLKMGYISEIETDKRWKLCSLHGWIDKTKG